MGMREHHHDFFICTEVQIVERFKVCHGGIATLIEYGYPTGNTTITTVYNRKILLCLLFIQIMGNFVCDFFRINLRNQTTELTHPKLHLNIQERTQFSHLAGSRMRNQCKQGIDNCCSVRQSFQIRVMSCQIFCDFRNLIICTASQIDN